MAISSLASKAEMSSFTDDALQLSLNKCGLQNTKSHVAHQLWPGISTKEPTPPTQLLSRTQC
jgi:hypothetical protein